MTVRHESIRLYDILLRNLDRAVDLRHQPYNLTVTEVTAGVINRPSLSKDRVKQHCCLTVLNRPKAAVRNPQHSTLIPRRAIESYDRSSHWNGRRGIVCGEQLDLTNIPV